MADFKMTIESIEQIRAMSVASRVNFIHGLIAGKDLLSGLANEAKDENVRTILEVALSYLEKHALVRIEEVERYLCVVGAGRISSGVLAIKILFERISEDGELRLTMDDIRPGVTFDYATICDVKYSSSPCERARVVVLAHEDNARYLKNSNGLL